jgi:hypothetical protein
MVEKEKLPFPLIKSETGKESGYFYFLSVPLPQTMYAGGRKKVIP